MPIFPLLPLIFSLPLSLPAADGPLPAGAWEVVTIDTSGVLALAGARDGAGSRYALLVTPDLMLKIYRSTDGTSWESGPVIPVPAPVLQAEMITTPTAAGLFIFLLTADSSGDLWLVRTSPDLSRQEWLPVAVGPERIDRFTATADNSSRPWLYCLYVAENRTGPNGRFLRSSDLGSTWEPAQEFYNCHHPCLAFSAGTLHCVWSQGPDNRQLLYARNRHFGTPGRWEPLRVIYATGERCLTPVVVQADTLPPWRAPVWIAWTVCRRDTEMLDLLITCSTDGGSTFSEPANLGIPFIDEWWPNLDATSTTLNLIYNAGGGGENEPTVIYHHYARSYAPRLFSSPLKINDSRANATGYGARPRAIGTDALFSGCGPDRTARGLYFRRLVPPLVPRPQTPKPNFQPTGMLIDATGRRVCPDRQIQTTGVYFRSEGSHWRKILIINHSSKYYPNPAP